MIRIAVRVTCDNEKCGTEDDGYVEQGLATSLSSLLSGSPPQQLKVKGKRVWCVEWDRTFCSEACTKAYHESKKK